MFMGSAQNFFQRANGLPHATPIFRERELASKKVTAVVSLAVKVEQQTQELQSVESELDTFIQAGD